MRRVVVTGLGLVTPLGGDVETSWNNLIAGKSGAGPITRFDASNQKATIACEVKGKDHEWGFDPDKRVDHKVQRQVDPFIVYGIDAAGQALEDAGLTDMTQEEKERTGCSIGAGIGGLPGIESESIVLHERGPGRVSPHFVHGRLINLVTGQVQIKYGFMGPNHAVVTACSTGAHSIGDAARMIAMDDAEGFCVALQLMRVCEAAEHVRRDECADREGEAASARQLPEILKIVCFWYFFLNLNEITVITIYMYLALIASILSVIFIRLQWLKKLIIIFASCLLVLVISLGIKAYSQHSIERGVVIADESKIRYGPGEEYEPRFEIHEGAEVRIEEKKDKWYKVYVYVDVEDIHGDEGKKEAEFKTGWIPASEVGEI